MKSAWLDAFAWMERLGPLLPQSFHPELPRESDPDFWKCAAQLEMATRGEVSALCARLVAGEEPSPISPLHGWFFHRRAEWAIQIFEKKIEAGVEPPPDVPIEQVLTWALIETWNTDGCIAFWNHAIERGGKPPAGKSSRSQR